MSSARHLLTVWNPHYTSDIHQHFAVLLDWVARYDAEQAGEDDIYVWWGKVRSERRQQALPHEHKILELGTRLAGQRETHLYVTDYRSLYVGDVREIRAGDLPDAEQAHVPPYYREKKYRCDFWFKLADMRRLVTDDLPLVAAELRALRNVEYHDNPVSLYGGIVNPPLLVERPDGRQYFDEDERAAIAGDKLWVEYDSERAGGTAAIEADLRDNVLGEDVWIALTPIARTSLAVAEKLFRDHRADPAFDFAPVIGEFAKALEVQCNAVLRDAGGRLPADVRTVETEKGKVDLGSGRSLTLGEIPRAITGKRGTTQALARALTHGDWFTRELPKVLTELRKVRNPGVHEARVDRDTAAVWRNRILGVGCTGEIVELASVRRG